MYILHLGTSAKNGVGLRLPGEFIFADIFICCVSLFLKYIFKKALINDPHPETNPAKNKAVLMFSSYIY